MCNIFLQLEPYMSSKQQQHKSLVYVFILSPLFALIGCELQHVGHHGCWSAEERGAAAVRDLHPYSEEDEPRLGRASKPAGSGCQTRLY